MTAILTPLTLQPLPDRLWLVVNDFKVVMDTMGPICVPAGFKTDLSSIPRCLWWESTPSDYPEAGTVHDYLYANNKVPQATADAVYRELLTFLDAGKTRGFLRYYALRMFGHIAYKHDATESQNRPATPPTPAP